MRAKLLQTNEYDLLMKVNDNLASSTGECDIRHCIMNALYGEDKVPFMCSGDCDSCIQSWLNETGGRYDVCKSKRATRFDREAEEKAG